MTAPHRAGTARCAPAPRGRTLAVVGALYLVANTGYSFFFLTLGTILLSRDVPLGAVAAINMLGAVYFLRFLTAPIIDRARPSGFGRYRGWLLLTQPPLIATLAALAALDPVADLPLTLALTIVFLGLSVFHDTALNGLAVRLLRRGEHGVGNGVQMASASASLLIGSSGALLLYAHAGWTVTLLALAAVHLVPFAVLTRIREPPEPDGRAAAIHVDRRARGRPGRRRSRRRPALAHHVTPAAGPPGARHRSVAATTSPASRGRDTGRCPAVRPGLA